jgi:plastocyanin
MASSAPIVDRIRIIPRPNDFLDRNVGSNGQVYFNSDSSSLRVYNGKIAGGFEIARADLNNVSNTNFLAKATAAGVSSTGGVEWDNVNNKPTFATVATSGSYNDLINTPTIPSLAGYATAAYVDNAILLSTGIPLGSAELFSIAADDSTLRIISSNESIQIIGGTGITTSSDAEGNITITSAAASTTFATLTDASTASLTIDKIYEPAIAMLRVDNVGTSVYTFNSHYAGNNPTIYVLAGTTIAFDLSAVPGHPFQIQDSAGAPYNTGLVHVSTTGVVSIGAAAQDKSSGTLYWRVPESIFGTYRYQCQLHVAMVGGITIKRLSVI